MGGNREIAEIEYDCTDCYHSWVKNYTIDKNCPVCDSTNIVKQIHLE